MEWSQEEIEKIQKLLLSEDESNQLIGLELLKQGESIDDFIPLLAFLRHADEQRQEVIAIIEKILSTTSKRKRTYWENTCKVFQKVTKPNFEKFEKHEKLFDTYIKTSPRFSELYYWLGIRLRSFLNDNIKGLEYLRKAADYNPHDYDANFNYAYHLDDSPENLDIVIKHYSRCIYINNSHYEAYHNLGKAYAAKGDITRAIKTFREGLTKSPTNVDSRIELSLLVKEQGDLHEARQLLEQALELSPGNDLANNNFAFLLWDSFQEYDLALEYIQKAIKIRPKYALYWHTLAEVEWYGFKNKKNALAALQKAKKVDKNYTAGDAMIAELKLIK